MSHSGPNLPPTDRRYAPPPREHFEPVPAGIRDLSVPAWIERQVERFAEQTAVSAGTTQLTYRQLNRAANRLAHELLERLGPGSEPVALLLDHSPALIVSMLGVIKAGKALLVADPTQARRRLDYLREDAGFRAAITQPEYRDKLEPREIMDVDADRSRFPADNPGLDLGPETLAALIYTSGSTGRPKAARRPHSSVQESACQMSDRARVDRDDRIGIVHAMAAGTLVGGVFGGLSHGASLAPFDLRREGLLAMAQWLNAERVTQLSIVGSVFRQFASMLSRQDRFPDLRLLRVGGETVFWSDLELFRTHFGTECALRVGMGASECCEVASWVFYPGDPVGEGKVPIGVPPAGVEVSIVGDDGRPVPAGSIGEIVVRSAGVGSGYWKRDELSRDRFAPDPDGGHRRVYRTGDLGRQRPDGFVEHHGRKDSQFQIRGNRVEPAEIEAALRETAGISDAVAVVRGDPETDQVLVAYFVTSGPEEPTTSDLRKALLSRLPEPMVPTHFVALDAMPRTETGKIDRSCLPELDFCRPRLDVAYVAPADPLEELLAGLFSELVGVEQVGVHDSFFDLGGQSLKAARLTARIWQILGCEIRLVDFFQRPTISWLASTLTSGDEKARRVRRIAELHRQVAAMSDKEVGEALQALDMEARV